MKGTGWSEEQRKLAFHLYCQLPFGRLHHRAPEIIELAGLIGRTPSAVAMKLVNFASLDPAVTGRGRKGLSGASEGDRETWREFHADWEGLAFDCARLLEELRARHADRPDVVSEDFDSYVPADFTGETRQALVEQRVRQRFFRRAVLSSYHGRCCMSGLSEPRLLNASHIIPWSEDAKNRLNPSNGLCLSAIHDRAFDQHLVSLSEDLRILVGSELKRRSEEPLIEKAFLSLEGREIEPPWRFRPDPTFLASHREAFMRLNP